MPNCAFQKKGNTVRSAKDIEQQWIQG